MSFNNEVVQLNNISAQAPRMSWNSLLCHARLHPKPPVDSPERSAFEVDYDRLIFSKAFRRLARKTQVHPLAVNDHTHNRLTHSLEVASVGRSFGKAAYYIAKAHEKRNIPGDAIEFAELIQAACLAHDIGNTPFGHAGERSIRQWMNANPACLSNLSAAQKSDLTLYEGNAQAFRIATRSVSEFESGCINRQGGLGLTAATLATMMKYPWHSNHPYAQAHGKYSVFQEDSSAFEWVANETGLLYNDDAYCRHPLAFLVEAADDICNAIIDIEDAIELNILQREEIEHALMQLSGLPATSPIAQMRAKAIGMLITQCLQIFDDNYNDIMQGQFQTPLIQLIDKAMFEAFSHLNTTAQNQVYPFQQDEHLEQSCNLTLARILSETMQSTISVDLGKPDIVTEPFLEFFTNALKKNNAGYERCMMTMDFVAGMTDNYAVNLADRLEMASHD